MSEYNREKVPKPAVKQRKSPPKCSEEHTQLLSVYNRVQKTAFNLREYEKEISEVLSQDVVSGEKIMEILWKCKDLLQPLKIMISVTEQALNNRSPNGSVSGDSLSVERWSSSECLPSPIRSRASSTTSATSQSGNCRHNSASYPQPTEKTKSETTLTHTRDKPIPPPRPTKSRSKQPVQPSIHESKTDTLQPASTEDQQPSDTIYQNLQQVIGTTVQHSYPKQPSHYTAEKPSPAPRSRNLQHKQLKQTLTQDSIAQLTIREDKKPLYISSVLSMSGLATSMPQLNVMFDDDDDQTGDSGMGTGSGSADYALCNQWTKLSDKPMTDNEPVYTTLRGETKDEVLQYDTLDCHKV